MGGGIPENVAVDVREAVRLQSRPPSVPIGFVPQKSHSQAGLATSSPKCTFATASDKLQAGERGKEREMAS